MYGGRGTCPSVRRLSSEDRRTIRVPSASRRTISPCSPMFPSRTSKVDPSWRRRPAQQQQLDPPAGAGPGAVEPGRHHSGVVQDDHIARAEVLGQVVEAAVSDAAAGAGDDHEPGVVARLDGRLGDRLPGQLVVEVARLHRGGSRRLKVSPPGPDGPRIEPPSGCCAGASRWSWVRRRRAPA